MLISGNNLKDVDPVHRELSKLCPGRITGHSSSRIYRWRKCRLQQQRDLAKSTRMGQQAVQRSTAYQTCRIKFIGKYPPFENQQICLRFGFAVITISRLCCMILVIHLALYFSYNTVLSHACRMICTAGQWQWDNYACMAGTEITNS